MNERHHGFHMPSLFCQNEQTQQTGHMQAVIGSHTTAAFLVYQQSVWLQFQCERDRLRFPRIQTSGHHRWGQSRGHGCLDPFGKRGMQAEEFFLHCLWNDHPPKQAPQQFLAAT